MPTYFDYPTVEIQKELKCIAESLMSPGKGIFAADESPYKMRKRLAEIGVENSEEIRRQWRELLFSTDSSINESISGVLLIHETLYQRNDDGRLLVDLLRERCIIPGIKVDKGLVYLYSSDNELGTQGLDDLEKRLIQYKNDGCEFARWRSVFKIGDYMPTYRALVTNADMIARFASLCQSQKMCPIIEPEVLPDGDHTIDRCQKVTETVLSFVFKALNDHHVFLEGIILKPSMVMAGLSCITKSMPEEIGLATITTLRRMVPPAVKGICFSSGGQTEQEATENLNAINQVVGLKPWKLTFAYGRALQASALRVWGGKTENNGAAQGVFLKRAIVNGKASMGQYNIKPNMVRNSVKDDTSASSTATPLQTQVSTFKPIVNETSPHTNGDFLPKSSSQTSIAFSPKPLQDDDLVDDEHANNSLEVDDEYECSETGSVDDDENETVKNDGNETVENDENETVDDDGNEMVEDEGNETVEDDGNEMVKEEEIENETVEDEENASADYLSNRIENFDRRSLDENSI